MGPLLLDLRFRPSGPRAQASGFICYHCFGCLLASKRNATLGPRLHAFAGVGLLDVDICVQVQDLFQDTCSASSDRASDREERAEHAAILYHRRRTTQSFSIILKEKGIKMHGSLSVSKQHALRYVVFTSLFVQHVSHLLIAACLPVHLMC